MDKMKDYIRLARVFTLVLVVLEAMPTGAVMYFASESGRVRSTFSYFDPITYGYACFGPFLTACLTIMLAAVLLLLFFYKKRILYRSAAVLSVSAVCTSLLPILYGLEWMSGISWCISVILICESVLLVLYSKYAEK